MIQNDVYVGFSGRSWKYDSNVNEYFVEDECKSLLKRSELLREREETELDVSNPVVPCTINVGIYNDCFIFVYTDSQWNKGLSMFFFRPSN